MGDKFWKIYKKYGSYIILTAVFLFFALTQKAFLRPTNLINVLQQVAIYGIIATGVTFVMISGGTDLSVGGQVACNGLLMAAFPRSCCDYYRYFCGHCAGLHQWCDCCGTAGHSLCDHTVYHADSQWHCLGGHKWLSHL